MSLQQRLEIGRLHAGYWNSGRSMSQPWP
jgi:hypothetical protein